MSEWTSELPSISVCIPGYSGPYQWLLVSSHTKQIIQKPIFLVTEQTAEFVRVVEPKRKREHSLGIGFAKDGDQISRRDSDEHEFEDGIGNPQTCQIRLAKRPQLKFNFLQLTFLTFGSICYHGNQPFYANNHFRIAASSLAATVSMATKRFHGSDRFLGNTASNSCF